MDIDTTWEVEIDFDNLKVTPGVVVPGGIQEMTVRVIDNDTGDVLVELHPNKVDERIYNIDSIFFRQFTGTAFGPYINHGVDIDDIKVTATEPDKKTEHLCLDGKDDDADGSIDCADVDCAAEIVCAPEDCFNGLDDNENGFTDCADSQCNVVESCKCKDGIDNDNDGKIDCTDSDCSQTDACNPRENCTAAGDEDLDGATNCADEDCRADPTCAALDPLICFAENFDVGTTAGQSIKAAPLSWNTDCRPERRDLKLAKEQHPNWIGNGVDGSTMTLIPPDVLGAENYFYFFRKLPAAALVKPGSQTGKWTLRARMWFDSQVGTAEVQIGFAGGPCTPFGIVALGLSDSPAYRWNLVAPASGDPRCTPCHDNDISQETGGMGKDVDVEIEIDWDLLPLGGEDDRNAITARVIDRATGNVDVEIHPEFSSPRAPQKNNIFLIDSVYILQSNQQTAQGLKYAAGVDVDDIVVTMSTGCTGGSRAERICDDAIDNDDDGKTDCADADCAAVTLCVTEDCVDGQDNNNNGAVDCDDPECQNGGVNAEEFCDCSNGKDDDQNGKTDCADTACAQDEFCTDTLVENCSNNTDDDADGKKDCADPDCRAAPDCRDPKACLVENFDVGTTAGQSIKDDPLGFTSCVSVTPANPNLLIANKQHPGWQGLGIDGSSATPEGAPASEEVYYSFARVIPGAPPQGDQAKRTGSWILRARAWVDSGATWESGIGFISADPCGGRIHFSYNGSPTGRKWTVDGRGVGGPDPGGLRQNSTLGTDMDIDIEIEIQWDDFYVESRVLDHDTGEELFKLTLGAPNDNLYNLNAVFVSAAHFKNKAGPLFTAGMDFDDITVTFSNGCLTTPENCTNGTDDDFDGKIDCADSDCTNDPTCKEAGNCADGKDNDVDGKTDCADSDCAADAACQVGARFFRGDADDNGKLELTDAVRILGFLFLGNQPPTCVDAGDADDNGKLELTDAVRVLGFLFLGNAPPAPPGPPGPGNTCGVDPTPNDAAGDLGCVSYTKC